MGLATSNGCFGSGRLPINYFVGSLMGSRPVTFKTINSGLKVAMACHPFFSPFLPPFFFLLNFDGCHNSDHSLQMNG
jgi:hypothetical protein